MPIIDDHYVNGYLYFDLPQCKVAGEQLHEAYRSATPFPHACLDDFLSETLLRRVAEEFPSTSSQQGFDREQERLKFQYHPKDIDSALIKNLFAELNSEAFLKFLEALTGIDGLIADPYYYGGGLHETKRGGHLGIHADFNIHTGMQLERRLNLLVYLNDDWNPEFGGNLELWSQDMKACQREIAPTLGRAVVFNTALDSYHGHPDPLNCPDNRSRRSMALYYYTALSTQLSEIPRRTTNFRPRPGSADRRDWSVMTRHFINDWVPPRLQHYIKAILSRGA